MATQGVFADFDADFVVSLTGDGDLGDFGFAGKGILKPAPEGGE